MGLQQRNLTGGGEWITMSYYVSHITPSKPI